MFVDEANMGGGGGGGRVPRWAGLYRRTGGAFAEEVNAPGYKRVQYVPGEPWLVWPEAESHWGVILGVALYENEHDKEFIQKIVFVTPICVDVGVSLQLRIQP